MNDIPSSSIGEQSLTQPPFTSDTTLVDDTVILVDDPTALVGGPVTTIEGIRVKVEPDRVWTNIPISS